MGLRVDDDGHVLTCAVAAPGQRESARDDVEAQPHRLGRRLVQPDRHIQKRRVVVDHHLLHAGPRLADGLGPSRCRVLGIEPEPLLVGQRVVPERAPLTVRDGVPRQGVPGELEPLVGPGEEQRPGQPDVVNDPDERRVHGEGVLLGVVALVPAVRTEVGRADRGRHPHLGDHQRHRPEVSGQIGQVAGVRILDVVQPVRLIARLVPQEVRVVGVGVEARERAARPGSGGADVRGVDPDDVLAGKRFVPMAQRVGGGPVDERDRRAAALVGLGRRELVHPRGEPPLRR